MTMRQNMMELREKFNMQHAAERLCGGMCAYKIKVSFAIQMQFFRQ